MLLPQNKMKDKHTHSYTLWAIQNWPYNSRHVFCIFRLRKNLNFSKLYLFDSFSVLYDALFSCSDFLGRFHSPGATCLNLSYLPLQKVKLSMVRILHLWKTHRLLIHVSCFIFDHLWLLEILYQLEVKPFSPETFTSWSQYCIISVIQMKSLFSKGLHFYF